MSANSGSSLWSDYTGVALSGICAVHCAVTPLIALSMPHLSVYFHDFWVHGSFFVLVAPLAVFAFYKCYGEHGRWLPPIVGALGLLLLSFFLVMESFHRHYEALTWTGSLFLVSGHWLNLRYCKHTRAASVSAKGSQTCC